MSHQNGGVDGRGADGGELDVRFGGHVFDRVDQRLVTGHGQDRDEVGHVEVDQDDDAQRPTGGDETSPVAAGGQVFTYDNNDGVVWPRRGLGCTAHFDARGRRRLPFE